MSSEKSRSVNFNIGERLRQYAETFGGISKLADALSISQPRLSNYLAGTREIPNRLVLKLSDLGCDVNWLLTGVDNEGVQKRFSAMVEREKAHNLTEDEWEIITELRRLGIGNTKELIPMFEPDALKNRLNKRVSELTRFLEKKEIPLRKVAEGIGPYNRKKKGGKQ